MAIPSPVKFKKGQVELVSSVDRASYTLTELTRAALKDTGRLILMRCARKLRALPGGSKFMNKKRTGKFQFWVRKQENDLIIGIHNLQRGAHGDAWYGELQELGTSNQPRREILQSTVRESIEDIRKIQGAYLSAIEDDIRAQELIDENEEIGEAGDDDTGT